MFGSLTTLLVSRTECWEPILEALWLRMGGVEAPFILDEAWSFDCQNHGEAATLNAETLLQPPFNGGYCEPSSVSPRLLLIP